MISPVKICYDTCLDESYTSVDVTHEQLPVIYNLEVCHRNIAGLVWVVENAIALAARHTRIKALDDTSAGTCIDDILQKQKH